MPSLRYCLNWMLRWFVCEHCKGVSTCAAFNHPMPILCLFVPDPSVRRFNLEFTWAYLNPSVPYPPLLPASVHFKSTPIQPSRAHPSIRFALIHFEIINLSILSIHSSSIYSIQIHPCRIHLCRTHPSSPYPFISNFVHAGSINLFALRPSILDLFIHQSCIHLF